MVHMVNKPHLLLEKVVRAPTTATSLQNLFKPIGGAGGKPVKDPFLPRFSPTDSDDNDKWLDIGDENVGDIS